MDVVCIHGGSVIPTTFTIKQVPDALADRQRERASANRRSLQQELQAILEDAVEWASVPAGETLDDPPLAVVKHFPPSWKRFTMVKPVNDELRFSTKQVLA